MALEDRVNYPIHCGLPMLYFTATNCFLCQHGGCHARIRMQEWINVQVALPIHSTEAFTMSSLNRAMASNDLQWKIVADVLRERDRQDQLKASGRFKFTCADPELIDTQRLAILLEEVGEAGRAILNQIGLAKDQGYRIGHDHLRTELIQVMAVALAWVEGIDHPREIAADESGLSSLNRELDSDNK